MGSLTKVQKQLRQSFANTLILAEYFCTNSLKIKRIRLELPTLYNCTAAAYPTLVDVKMSHGKCAAILLVSEAVINFCQSMSILKPTEDQASEMAELVYEDAYFLNMYELHEFFKRLRKGTYGGFFGSIDSCKVIEKLTLFLVDRQKVMLRIKLDQEERKRKEIARIIANTPSSPMPESLKQMITELDFSVPEIAESEHIAHRCPICDTLVYGLADHIWCPTCQYLGSPNNTSENE